MSVAGGVYATVWVSHSSYERILMAISFGAITITCVDVILTADVRDKEE